MHAHRAFRGAAVAGALLCAGAPAALGAASWHGPTPIGPSGARAAPALTSHGEALAAWIVRSGATANWRVQVKVRHGVRFPWHGPITLASGFGWNVPTPVAALNARGDALVLWRPEGRAVQAASRSGWRDPWRVRALPSGPAIAGDPAHAGFAAARVALAPDGGAAVLWATQERTGSAIGPGVLPGRYVIRGARRASRSGAWRESPVLGLAPVVDIGWTVLQPHLAVDAAGDAVALWINATPKSVQTPLAHGAIEGARRTGDGPWSGPVTLADPAGLGDVAIAADGRAAAVWQERAESYGLATPISLAVGEAGASGWSAPQAGPGFGRQPRVAVNTRGDVLVGWGDPFVPNDPANDTFVAHAAVRPAGGAWGAIGTFPSGGQTFFADLHPTLDPAGRGYMTWNTGYAREQMVHAVAGSASGWPRSGRLSASGTGAHIVAGRNGTALTLLGDERGLWAASYDGSPRSG